MSYAMQIKNEIAKVEATDAEMMAELSAIVTMNGSIGLSNKGLTINVQTENAAIARRIYSLLKDKYHTSSDLVARKRMKLKKNHVYIVKVNEHAKLILEDLCIYGDEGILVRPNEFLVEDMECKQSYLRGAFLAGGSVNDPKTAKYHLEIATLEENHANFLKELMDEFNLNAKVLARKKGFIVYLKEAEKISDFLRLINAFNGVFYFEDIRIYRDHKNMTNRLNNAEQANTERSMSAASKHLENIKIIENEMGLDLLEDKLKEVAIYRRKYEDVSLQELSEIITYETGNTVSKSGINHRLRKINEIANRIREIDEIKAKENS